MKTSTINDKALRVVSKIVDGMPDREKEDIIATINEDKKTRDYVLKILFWTFCSKDVIADVSQKERVRGVIRKWERKRPAKKARELAQKKA